MAVAMPAELPLGAYGVTSAATPVTVTTCGSSSCHHFPGIEHDDCCHANIKSRVKLIQTLSIDRSVSPEAGCQIVMVPVQLAQMPQNMVFEVQLGLYYLLYTTVSFTEILIFTPKFNVLDI